MFLTDEEKGMLAGSHGPGIQRAMELLVKLGESFDAEKFVPITYGHISYDFSPEKFWDLMTEGVEKTEHRVTTHPSFSPEIWKERGLPLGAGDRDDVHPDGGVPARPIGTGTHGRQVRCARRVDEHLRLVVDGAQPHLERHVDAGRAGCRWETPAAREGWHGDRRPARLRQASMTGR